MKSHKSLYHMFLQCILNFNETFQDNSHATWNSRKLSTFSCQNYNLLKRPATARCANVNIIYSQNNCRPTFISKIRRNKTQ